MKVLIIRFSSIGDIVLTSPVIRGLKLQLNATVHYLTKKSFENIVIHNPFIDKAFLIQKEVSEVIEDLKKEQYDLVIDLHKNIRSWQVRHALSAKSVAFDKLNVEKWLLVQLKINRLPHTHIVERYLATIAPFGVAPDARGLDYFIPPQDEMNIFQHFGWKAEQYIAFVTGAAHATKRLPESKIIEICQKLAKLQLPTVLLGGKEEVEKGERIMQAVASPFCRNACGQLNLHQSASVVRQSAVVISHDTGLMHIAAAFGRKIVAIWGNTVPAFGMYPYRTEHTSFEINTLRCRPCSKIGFDKCPKGHFRCMNDLDMDKVVQQVQQYFV
jgi:ADP-heptose:LPS heptosyltransferase